MVALGSKSTSLALRVALQVFFFEVQLPGRGLTHAAMTDKGQRMMQSWWLVGDILNTCMPTHLVQFSHRVLYSTRVVVDCIEIALSSNVVVIFECPKLCQKLVKFVSKSRLHVLAMTPVASSCLPPRK